MSEPNPEPQSEIEIVFTGDSALVAGPEAAMAALFEHLDVQPASVQSAGQSARDLLAGVAGVGALSSAFDPQWVHMTAKSYQRLNELGEFNKLQGGLLTGVIRGDKGRIDQLMQFDTKGINPAMMANVATLAATLALRSAVEQLQTLVEAMDVKLDLLLEDNRTAAFGDMQGLTHVLTRAFSLYEETGRISDTAWSQIAGHASALAQTEARARGHVDTLAASLAAKSFADRADAAAHAANGELQRWLIILSAAQVNQQRLEVLELAHLRQHAANDVTAHAEAARTALDERRRALTDCVQRLSDSLSGAADLSDAHRVRSPFKARNLLRDAENSLALVTAFAEVTSLDIRVPAELGREPWRKSLTGLAKGTVTEVRSTVTAVPAELNRRREDHVLRKADRISEKAELIMEKRALTDGGSETSGDVIATDQKLETN